MAAAVSGSDHLSEWFNRIDMKRKVEVDVQLLAEARAACGAKSDEEAVRMGLEALIRTAAFEHLRLWRGSEPNAVDVPRRRETS